MKLTQPPKFLLSGVVIIAVLLLNIISVGAQTDSVTDYDRARSAVEAGKIAPLVDVMSKVEEMYAGEIIEVQLEDKNTSTGDVGIGGTGLSDNNEEIKIKNNVEGKLLTSDIIYNVKLLTPQGNVLNIKMNAKTTEIITVRGRDAESARKD